MEGRSCKFFASPIACRLYPRYPILTVDKGSFKVSQARLAPVMISKPGHGVPKGANAGLCQPGNQESLAISLSYPSMASRVAGEYLYELRRATAKCWGSPGPSRAWRLRARQGARSVSMLSRFSRKPSVAS